MRCSFAFAALSALFTFSSAVVVQPSDVGPLSPDKHPSTSLQESVRRMKLSLERELVYLAHMEHISKETDTDGMVVRQQDDPAIVHGFTTGINDGTGIFRPILPGSIVPPARMIADEPVESPIEEPEDGMETAAPTITNIDVPIVSPFVETVTSTPTTTDLPVMPTEVPVEPTESTPPRDVTFTPVASPVPEPPVDETPVPLPVVPVAGGVAPGTVPTGTDPTGTDPTGAEPTDADPTGAEPTDAEPTDAAPTDEGVTDGEAPLTQPGVIGINEPDLFATDEATATPEDDDPVCFPSHATVQLEDGSVKSMADVQIGDRVMVAPDSFSEVFMFTHKLSNVRHNFVSLDLSSGHEISLTRGHYLYVNGRLSAASTVKKGDTLMLADSSLAQVTRVSSVESTGLFNPQTVQGDIVVNGVLASTYTTAVEPTMAHALLAPLRAAYSRLGFCMTAFDAGADMLASYMPSGSVVN